MNIFNEEFSLGFIAIVAIIFLVITKIIWKINTNNRLLKKISILLFVTYLAILCILHFYKTPVFPVFLLSKIYLELILGLLLIAICYFPVQDNIKQTYDLAWYRRIKAILAWLIIIHFITLITLQSLSHFAENYFDSLTNYFDSITNNTRIKEPLSIFIQKSTLIFDSSLLPYLYKSIGILSAWVITTVLWNNLFSNLLNKYHNQETLLHKTIKPLFHKGLIVIPFPFLLTIIITAFNIFFNKNIDAVAIVVSLVYLLIMYLILPLTRLVDQHFKEIIRQTVDAEHSHLVTIYYGASKLFTSFIYVLLLIMTIGILNYVFSGLFNSLLAFTGVLGALIGFSAKEYIQNIIATLQLLFTDVVRIGDWIKIKDKGISGKISKINWGTIEIIPFEGMPITVKTETVINNTLFNYTKRGNYLFNHRIGIRYDDFAKTEAIVKDISQLINDHPKVNNDMLKYVNFVAYGSSSLDIEILCYLNTIRYVEYHQITQELLIEIGKTIERHHAQFAFPTKTLHLNQTQIDQQRDDISAQASTSVAS